MPHHGAPAPALADLLPWRAWAHDRRLRTPAVALFATLVTVPSAGMLLGSGDADAGLLVFAVYFAAAWYLLLRAVIRPQSVGAADVAQVLVLALVTQKALMFGWYDLVGDLDHDDLLATTFGTGVPEEAVKLLPVAVLALVHRRAWSRLAPRDFLFLGLVSGLAFGTSEAVLYVTENYSPGSTDATTFVWRLVDGPIVHACWAGISAYFLGLALTRHRASAAWLIALGLSIPVLLHGLNNWTPVSGTVAWVGIALVSGLLVLGYAQVGVRAPTPVAPTLPPTAPDPVTERLVLPAPGTFVGPDGRLWG